MSDTSTILSLPYIQPAQAQKHITHNEALRRLDVLVQPVVTDHTRTAPPADPAQGARYIVGAGAMGDWAGQDGAIAVFEGTWGFIAPLQGWRVYASGPEAMLTFDGAEWVSDTGNFGTLGVNAAADAVNRLAVSSDATLLTHAGAGHQVKVNKAAAGDTASLLFQTGFSGRAEMGIAGGDDFAIKVSADGASWSEALAFDAATGLPRGAAVQSDASDVAPGRLLTLADAGTGPAGAFRRTGDGWLTCTGTVSLPFESASACAGTWVFPAGFAPGREAEIVVSFQIDSDASSLTPTYPNLCVGEVSGITATGVTLRQHRRAGGTSFDAADTVVVRVTVMGPGA
jgi:hypothetical protein